MSLALSTQEALDFLRDVAPLLEGGGFGVPGVPLVEQARRPAGCPPENVNLPPAERRYCAQQLDHL